MAVYRNISMDFWTDSKVVDDFTPEDRYFHIYLLTNPHTNLCGCYEVSVRQISNETGYSTDTVLRLIDRFQTIHKTLEYCKETKEILVLNWYKYNWTASPKLDKPLLKDIESIKNDKFRNYVGDLYNKREPAIPYLYPIDTTVSVSVTDTVSVSVTETEAKPKKATPNKYGEYGWVKLTEEQYNRLLTDLGEAETLRCIKYIDESAQGNGNKNKWKDWNLVIRRCHREGWGNNQGYNQGNKKKEIWGCSGTLGQAEMDAIKRALEHKEQELPADFEEQKAKLQQRLQEVDEMRCFNG